MRVFVSSTYQDLVDHRRAVADALERLGLQLERMEAFGARPQDATRACLAEVEASELFVGIYAHRYGYIPRKSAVSITEAEFDHAFNNRRPTFCFFVDEGYPWPKDLKEGEPGRSRLRKFKKRVEKLVVRDSFTTPEVLAGRVATSVGRYLLADPRRHGAPNAARYAHLVLADLAAMAFVDVMRLACVAGSDRARAVNQPRYKEFVDMADIHLSEYRTQVTRLSADSDLDTLSKCGDVERSLAWQILRLRRDPSLDRGWHEFVGTLRDTAERVNTLAETISHDYYAARVGEVVSVVKAAVRQVPPKELAHSPDRFVMSRFSTQSAVINQMKKSGGFAAATIRDDVDRRLAIPYFALDLELLRKAMRAR
jgi:hypothetical protein